MSAGAAGYWCPLWRRRLKVRVIPLQPTQHCDYSSSRGLVDESPSGTDVPVSQKGRGVDRLVVLNLLALLLLLSIGVLER